jgi:hypothetical protein
VHVHRDAQVHVQAAEERPVGAGDPQAAPQTGGAADEDREDIGRRTEGEGAPGVQSEEPRGIERGIADADKRARTGSKNEPVRNTPPAGAWNDTASD